MLEQINVSCGTWSAAVDLTNAFFFMLVHKAHQKHFAFNWQGQQYTFTALLKRYISSLAQCHKLLVKDFDHFSFPQDSTLIHYIDDIVFIDIVFIGHEVATILDLLVKHLHVRR